MPASCPVPVPGTMVIESCSAPLQGPGDLLHGHVSGRPCFVIASGQHLTCAGGFQFPVVVLVNGHAAQQRIIRFLVGWLRGQLYIKCSTGMHGCSFFCPCFCFDGGLIGCQLGIGPFTLCRNKNQSQRDAQSDTVQFCHDNSRCSPTDCSEEQ